MEAWVGLPETAVVLVGVGVFEGVWVQVGVDVLVWLVVGVAVRLPAGEGVAVFPGVWVNVGEAAAVFVGVLEGVAVGVDPGAVGVGVGLEGMVGELNLFVQPSPRKNNPKTVEAKTRLAAFKIERKPI